MNIQNTLTVQQRNRHSRESGNPVLVRLATNMQKHLDSRFRGNDEAWGAEWPDAPDERLRCLEAPPAFAGMTSGGSRE
jgi:hypothetical protein